MSRCSGFSTDNIENTEVRARIPLLLAKSTPAQFPKRPHIVVVTPGSPGKTEPTACGRSSLSELCTRRIAAGGFLGHDHCTYYRTTFVSRPPLLYEYNAAYSTAAVVVEATTALHGTWCHHCTATTTVYSTGRRNRSQRFRASLHSPDSSYSCRLRYTGMAAWLRIVHNVPIVACWLVFDGSPVLEHR